MIEAGAQVEHSEFGIGKVIAVLGDVATVDFFGERLDVGTDELLPRISSKPSGLPSPKTQSASDLVFRKICEAVNLGVVPGDPDQVVGLTIGGQRMADEISRFLANAVNRGACRVFMGYYGSGKSHHLHFVRSVALRDGWVTASLELDPKAADPAKPSTVYQGLIGGLSFPMRADGTRSTDFFDLIKEIRDHWTIIRDLPYFKRSPWFGSGLTALLHLSHRRDDAEYVAGVNWLAGQVKQISAIRSLTWRAGYRNKIPSLPQSKDTGLVYAYNLVVIHKILQALGYKGLAIIIDEAEHIRAYSSNRMERAKNFFDIITRCAHRPRDDLDPPHSDYEYFELPDFWRAGPHFALFVGLTEGEHHQQTDETSVLIRDENDIVRLSPPNANDYETWSRFFLHECAKHLGPRVHVLSDGAVRSKIAATLRHYFETTPVPGQILRNWIKLAGLPAAILLSSGQEISADTLAKLVEDAARQVT